MKAFGFLLVTAVVASCWSAHGSEAVESSTADPDPSSTNSESASSGPESPFKKYPGFKFACKAGSTTVTSSSVNAGGSARGTSTNLAPTGGKKLTTVLDGFEFSAIKLQSGKKVKLTIRNGKQTKTILMDAVPGKTGYVEMEMGDGGSEKLSAALSCKYE